MTAAHPNVAAEVWPDHSPAGRFARLVHITVPTWVWVVYIRHVTDHFGGIYVGPVRSRDLADQIATAIEDMHMPGVRELRVERVDGHAVPLEFADDSDWALALRCLRNAADVHRVAWLVDYLMRGGGR